MFFSSYLGVGLGGVALLEKLHLQRQSFRIKSLPCFQVTHSVSNLWLEVWMSSQIHALTTMPASCCQSSSLWWNLISGTIGSNKPFLREFVLVITLYHFNRKLSNIPINVLLSICLSKMKKKKKAVHLVHLLPNIVYSTKTSKSY